MPNGRKEKGCLEMENKRRGAAFVPEPNLDEILKPGRPLSDRFQSMSEEARA